MIAPKRRRHQIEVEAFLQEYFGNPSWTLTLPRGSGQETYVATSGEQVLFVKVGAQIERTVALANAGLTPPVLRVGRFEDGIPVMVQPFMAGHHPGRPDYRSRLDEVARTVREIHQNEDTQASLPPVPSDDYATAGLRSLAQVKARWEQVRPEVPAVAGLVDAALDELEQRMTGFTGSGLVASHNDICWDNWLFAGDGRIYLVDLDAMSLDDPALDVGALLWWYYPPELWPRFLQAACYPDNDYFRERMWARLALHCLNITLPRPGSFDTFDPAGYTEKLGDFRAAIEKMPNPELS